MPVSLFPRRSVFAPPAPAPASAAEPPLEERVTARLRRAATPALLLGAFTLSGAAGLFYESTWSRYLGLFVGTAAYAQILVLVIFLGGMALGSWAAGAWSERLADPLRWYAGVELLVGALAIAFHPAFVAVTALAYDRLFPALAPGLPLAAARWSLAGLLILPQSVLLGTTFPLMSAGLLRRAPARPGWVLSLLYFANSIGAAAGVLVAGFWLVRILGLPGTLRAAAALNVVVALAALAAARLPTVAVEGEPADGAAAAADGAARDAAREAPREAPLPARVARLLLGVAFGTAVASFVYEIGWIRMLALVLGSATHAFELMLSAFIFGLALGALWARAHADRFVHPVRALGVVQWVMGALALATLPLYLESFHWTEMLFAMLTRTPEGYRAFTAARYGICLLVMLPATFCAGITLPLITKLLLRDGTGGATGERAIGVVYALNTLGSIVGAALAGLVLLPLLGLRTMLVAGALVDMGLGLALLAEHAGRRVLRPALVATAVVVAAVTWGARFDRAVLTSGVYRYGRIAAGVRVVYYRDGRTATASVREATRSGFRTLATNGKPDASLGARWRDTAGLAPGDTLLPLDGDLSTQILLPLVTLAHAPRARTAAVIGLGSGMTSQLLLGRPTLERVATIEIEPVIVDAARRFLPANARVFTDPRSRLVLDDARSYFAAAHRRFDVVISEPSNPWVSGVSGLFTREFYRRVRGYLSDDGVFGQWLHLYEIDDDLVLSVMAALQESFGDYAIYQVASTDILIVATNRATLPPPDWSVVRSPGIARDLRFTRALTPRELEAMRLGTRAVLGPVVALRGEPNSDFHPLLDLGAERTRYLSSLARGFADLARATFDPLPVLMDERIDFGAPLRPAVPSIPRVHRLAFAEALRAAERSADTARLLDRNDTVATARFRRQTLALRVASGAPPADWPAFVRLALMVEDDLHGGTSGVADERFYAPLRAYLRRAGAPGGAVAAVAFMHALRVWDFPAAAREADTLAARLARGEEWIDPDLLRDGAATARLRMGDLAGAHRVLVELAPASARSARDLRSWLLPALVQELEEARDRDVARAPAAARAATGASPAAAPPSSRAAAGGR